MVLLPGELQEASGIAPSPTRSGVYWTHNDGDSRLYAVSPSGSVLARFSLAERSRDLEDVATGACAEERFCLYLADTGDNEERRPDGDARILRVAEPDPDSPGVLTPEAFPVRLPDGARDIEAIFVLPGERVHLVTKGRSHGVTVYRYPGPLRPEVVTLEEVQRLTPGAQTLLDQVTGAAATPAGGLVAIRTYRALRFYRAVDESLILLEGGLVNLRPLEEIQGEGVGLGPDGLVLLTSEGGPLGGPAALSTLRCAARG